MRKDIDKHLEEDCPNRDYSCEDCGEKGTYASIIIIHQKCLKKPVPCPNGCSVIVQRQHVSEHVATECELTVITCKYKRLGCDRELKRKDMAAHEEDDKLHLCMAMDTTVKLENKTVELEDKTVELENKTVKLEREKRELKSQSVELKKETLDLKCKTVELEYKTAKLEDALKVLKNGEPLKFKLTDYQKKKENNEYVQSPSYYTSPNGYHMALEVHANGDGAGQGTHVSVFAAFLKGKYDAQLKWPFIGKITFTLLNQLEDRNHHKKTLELTAEHNTQAGERAWGKTKFIPHAALCYIYDYDTGMKTRYRKDRTLYFRMSVEPADQDKPWLQ